MRERRARPPQLRVRHRARQVEDDADGDGRVVLAEEADLLRPLPFEDGEGRLREPRDAAARTVRHRDVEGDEVGVDDEALVVVRLLAGRRGPYTNLRSAVRLLNAGGRRGEERDETEAGDEAEPDCEPVWHATTLHESFLVNDRGRQRGGRLCRGKGDIGIVSQRAGAGKNAAPAAPLTPCQK